MTQAPTPRRRHALRGGALALAAAAAFASLPARAAVPNPSLRGARVSNGVAIAGLILDLGMAGGSLETFPSEKDTTENQLVTGFGHIMARPMGLIGAHRAARHLDGLGTPVTRVPVYAGLATTVVAGAITMNTLDSGLPRSPDEQLGLALVRGTAAACVALQVGLNIKTMPRRPDTSASGAGLHLSAGPGRLTLRGAF